MKNKIMIYVMLALAVVFVFVSGYYSAVFFGKIDSGTKGPIMEQEEQATEVLETIREDSFLIHGTIESISRDQNYPNPIVGVSIDMNENFKFSRYRIATRDFLIKEKSILNTAQKKENEKPIIVLEESAIIINDDSVLEEGDLVVIKAEESFNFILDMNVFSVIEMWKIIE